MNEFKGYFFTAWSTPIDAFQKYLENNSDVSIETTGMDPAMDWITYFVDGFLEEYSCSDCQADKDSYPDFVIDKLGNDLDAISDWWEEEE